MIPPLQYLERYRNGGTRDYSPHADYTEAREGYRPDSAAEAFQVAVFRLPRTAVNVYRAGPGPELEACYLTPDSALFCVHPQLVELRPQEPYLARAREVGQAAPGIRVTPSSSTRTLYVLDSLDSLGSLGSEAPEPDPGTPHALKVHFPFRISRYGRKMRDEVVEQAIAVSRELESVVRRSGARLFPDFAFMREVLGITHRNLDPTTPRGENWGYLIRETTPFPASSSEASLVPGFALYGRDYFDPQASPLLWMLMGESDPASFVLESVFLPVIRHWVTCFLETGFILEPHGQNVLLEVDREGKVRRIVHRDMNVGIDMRRRRELEAPDFGDNTYNLMETGEFASIAFDKFMGHHFFHRVVLALCQRFPQLRPEDLQEPCREEFARLFPDHRRYLPRTVRYFSEERDAFGKPLFQDTGTEPVWRP